MSNNLFARVPVGRNLLNSDSDYGRNLLNSEESLSEDADDIVMRLLGREPTPDEVGARMLAALQTPAAPDPAGDNLPERGPFSFVNDAITGVRDRYDMYQRQYHGEGRREENVPELPWNVQIGGKDTWVGAKMGLGRDSDRAVDDIALAQLPGAEFRRDQWGNLVVKLPEDATVADTYTMSAGADGPPIYNTHPRSVGRQEYYSNRPGFSPQDVVNATIDAIPAGVGGLIFNGLKKMPVGPVRAAAAATAAGTGADILLDEWAHTVGSRQPTAFSHAAQTGRNRLLPWPLPWMLPEL